MVLAVPNAGSRVVAYETDDGVAPTETHQAASPVKHPQPPSTSLTPTRSVHPRPARPAIDVTNGCRQLTKRAVVGIRKSAPGASVYS